MGEKGTTGVVDGSGKNKTGLLMETAEGMSVDAMIKNLPTEPMQRGAAMDKLRAAVKQVAKGLAELHLKMADGSMQSDAQKIADRPEPQPIVQLEDLAAALRVRHPVGDVRVRAMLSRLLELNLDELAARIPN